MRGSLFADARAARLAAGYAAFGIGWILLSDKLLFALVPDTAWLSALGEWKGIAFVLGTSALLYALAQRGAAAPAGAPARRRTGRRWAWLLLGAAIAVVCAGLAGAARLMKTMRQEAAQRLHAEAAQSADAAGRWLDQRVAGGHAVRADPGLGILLARWRAGSGEPADLVRHLGALRLGSPYQALQLLDAAGEPLLATEGASPPDAATRQRARAALAGGAPVASHLDLSPPGAGAHGRFDVLLPLRGRAGGASAVLLMRADPHDRLRPMLEAGPGSAVRLHLLRREGDELVLLDPAAVRTRRPLGAGDLALAGLFAGAARAGDLLEGRDADGAPGFAVALPLRETGWFIAAELPHARLLGRLWQDGAWIAMLNLLALLMAGGGAYLVWQRRELRLAQHGQAEQAQRLRAMHLLNAITDGSTDAIFAKDTQGRFLFVNPATCRLLGRPAADLIGRDVASCFPGAEADRLAASDHEVIAHAQVLRTEATLSTRDGKRHFLTTKGPLFDPEGGVAGVFGISRDITERKREEDERRQWAMAFESTRDGVMISDERARIVAVNRAFVEITGYEREDAIGRTPKFLRSGRHDGAFYRRMLRRLHDAGHWRGEVWNRRRNGEIYPQWLTIDVVRDGAGGVSHYVGVFTDITRMKNSQARLERLAHFDPLTRLPNRQLLQLRLRQAVHAARRHRQPMAVLSIDLDGFKTVNDSLGHPAGDELLACVAARLKARLRAQDTLGRLGGDEFLVLMGPAGEVADAASLARDLLAEVAQPVPLSGQRDAYVTASIGISVHPGDGIVTAVEMLRDADAAMYRAKDEGRNRFCFYTSDLNAEAVTKLELEAALSRAIERNELLLHYQPKVHTDGHGLSGLEALLRWRRSGGGLVPPGEFIPVAERSSLMLDIGAWVIDRACRQLREWLNAGLAVPRVAVNVAARQFAAGDLDRVVADALRRHDVPACALELELTEGMLIQQPQATAEMLDRLKALGVSIALDDFGTGYSSLGYLQRFPIDTLKIDQSFVRAIEAADTGSAIVDVVIGLAHRLNLRVVAEGVETPQQRDYLARLGCDEMQGYYFAKPAPPEELGAWLTGSPCAAPRLQRGQPAIIAV